MYLVLNFNFLKEFTVSSAFFFLLKFTHE